MTDFLFGLMIGAGCAAFYFAGLHERDVERNKTMAKELRERIRSEKVKRLDAEIDLEDATAIIGYQRDVLYTMRARQQLMEGQNAD